LMLLGIARQFDAFEDLLLQRPQPFEDTENNKRLRSVVELASSFSRLQLDETEMALLAAAIVLNPDIAQLKNPDSVEIAQDLILAAFQRYVLDTHPGENGRWSKLIMKAIDLRHLAEQLAKLGDVPTMLQLLGRLFITNNNPLT